MTNKVYEYRVLNKLTQEELAKVLGVSRQTILVMEKNKYVPSLLLAFRIAKYFNVSIEDIFTYHEGGNDAQQN
ncbi:MULTISPECIES: helix-turn-helix transcriptional regulator [Anoxybacillus]|uniref:helix-turn-helix transcriptional regulator n=1 Tax=Anoxybacillus TaxID=150247 RepID=UPI0005572E17|nr:MULTISPECIES: helix-turn-helix transcriptional regulator [Anoxybacillus]AST06339.1 transcriptional regulator [Anoxybacillus flavithermus]MBW9219690.1 helix-turn-helix transcriptional regulator [Anoxybacillus sp. ST70]